MGVCSIRINFNPRSHKGSDCCTRGDGDTDNISIHAPTRGATKWICQEPVTIGISIHAPTRGATKYQEMTIEKYAFQSTLPQGERQGLDGYCDSSTKISIHAPTRGATEEIPYSKFTVKISIHAPTRGATYYGISRNICNGDFNPRSHKGSDIAYTAGAGIRIISIHAPTRGATHALCPLRIAIGISIHAPTRGATQNGPMLPERQKISIHAPTRGATECCCYMQDCKVFQSTLPQGERRRWGDSPLFENEISIHAPTRGATTGRPVKRCGLSDFNPRSHKGSDLLRHARLELIQISIHAPTRGATIANNLHLFGKTISIHAPTRGATHEADKQQWYAYDFNPRSHKGSDEIPADTVIATPVISIHAPTRGATDMPVACSQQNLSFQSTLPQGERPLMIRIIRTEDIFQSTLPQGERLMEEQEWKWDTDFNPRSHKGSDGVCR